MAAELGIMIPILGILLGFFGVWTQHTQKMAKLQVKETANETAERAAQYASQVQKLDDRVQVLERIITDRGYDVATQIEALRDTRETDAANAGIPLDLGSKEKV
ncbi:MAG: hypothetical protein WBA51_13235 [Erythrobacter sp.]